MKRLHSLFARPIVRIVFLTTLVVVAVTLIILGNMPRWTAHSTAQPIAASEAAAIVKNGEARSIEVQLDHAYLKTDSAEYVFVKDREASVPQMLATLGVSSADMAKLTYSVDESAPVVWSDVIPSFLLVAAVIGVLFMTMRRSGHGPGLSFGRSRARRFVGQAQRVTFDDVAGAIEAKEELRELVDFLPS